MVANRQLASQRDISEEKIGAIDALHELLERLVDSYTLEIPYEEARDLVRSANMTLSNLWGFVYDGRLDVWTKRFNKRWLELTFAGRRFECKTTGEQRTIYADDCYECAFIPIGHSWLDVGRAGSYHRISSDLMEIAHEHKHSYALHP